MCGDCLLFCTQVGQFRELVEMTEQNSDLKHKLRHLLKLSPEKWEEVTQVGHPQPCLMQGELLGHQSVICEQQHTAYHSRIRSN